MFFVSRSGYRGPSDPLDSKTGWYRGILIHPPSVHVRIVNVCDSRRNRSDLSLRDFEKWRSNAH
jgi:hypothetical protein